MMKFLTDGETKSTQFHISLSVAVRGRRKYTDPVIVKSKDLSKREINLFTKIIEAYGKNPKVKRRN